MISKSFFETLEIIAQERNLEMGDILEKVSIALKKACQLEGIKGDIEVEYSDEKKRIKVFEIWLVVDELDPEGPSNQITLEDAKVEKSRVRIGTTMRNEINIEQRVGRKGASQFKQVFTQGLKELSRKRTYEFFLERENELINAKVHKITEDGFVLGLGLETETFMPFKEALPGEELVIGDEIKVYISKVEEGNRGPKVFVSRVHRDIIKRLFETIIPEVASGVVEIMAISRDPGQRTKVGVKSNNPNVDSKGSCVGLQGTRIKQINNALNGERVDIFNWRDDPVNLIAEALTPARVISVMIDEETHQSTVIVPDDQFSLAIGKGGQNARLASQVTTWKIDIKDEKTAYQEGIRFKPNVSAH